MSTKMNKTSNVYADYLSPRLYAATPKAVFAAMAVSGFLNRDGAETPAALDAAVREKWSTLHAQGIVPQKPPTAAGQTLDAQKTAQDSAFADQIKAKYTVNPYRNPADNAEPDAGVTGEPAAARLCDWWLKNRSKCSEPATHLTEDRHGAPLGFCDMHYVLRRYQGVEAGSDAGSTEEQVNDRHIANDHQGRGEDEV